MIVNILGRIEYSFEELSSSDLLLIYTKLSQVAENDFQYTRITTFQILASLATLLRFIRELWLYQDSSW